MATIESFVACVVGRRFQPKAECFDGEAMTFQHEVGNARDRNALLVVGSRGQVSFPSLPDCAHRPNQDLTAETSMHEGS